VDLAYHKEIGLHERVRPLFIESERTARETGNEHDGRFSGVTRGFCPNLGTVGGGDIDGHGGGDERDESEERGELHGCRVGGRTEEGRGTS